MRTNIEIDEKLMSKAKRLSRLRTKKDVVGFALDNLIKTLSRKSLIEFKGKVKWEGSLSAMRKS